jgi:hypothetical protein
LVEFGCFLDLDFGLDPRSFRILHFTVVASSYSEEAISPFLKLAALKVVYLHPSSKEEVPFLSCLEEFPFPSCLEQIHFPSFL